MNISLPFRLYVMEGCPHCDTALQILNQRNVPAQIVPALNDPVIDSGVKLLTKKDTAQYPVFVSFVTSPIEVIVGLKPEEYLRAIEVFNSKYRPSAPNAFVVKSDDSGQAAQVPAEPSPAPEGAV